MKIPATDETQLEHQGAIYTACIAVPKWVTTVVSK